MFILIWVTVLFANTAGGDDSSGNSTSSPKTTVQNNDAKTTSQYNCKKHSDTTENLILTFSSKSTNQSASLTCVCEVPLPTVKWQLFKNHFEFSVCTSEANNTFNCTVTVTVKDNDLIKRLLHIFTNQETIYAFLIGVLLSAILSTIFWCVVTKCHRNKLRTSGNLAVTLDMATTQKDPLIGDGQEVDFDQSIYQEAAELGGAPAAGKSDVDYSTINFSALKRPAKVENSEETTDTEYAEIKREEIQEELNGEASQDVVLTEEAEDTHYNMPEEWEGEGVVMCSDVNDITSQM